MKKLVLSVMALAVASTLFAGWPSGEVEAKRQARSVHLHWGGIVKDATDVVGYVNVTESQTNSYFMVIGFNGGYMGIQNVGGTHVGIFSIWDPVGHAFDFKAKPDDVVEGLRAKVLYNDPKVHVSRFGGEGTGAKTMFRYDWKTGSKVRFRITAEPDGADRIKFTGYIGEGNNEMKIATISRLSHGKKPVVSGVYSFVEDFWRNGYSKTLVRRAEFTDFASRVSQNEKYTPATGARFTADGNKLMTIDAGPVKGGGFLQTGGNTVNKTVPLYQWFKFDSSSDAAK